MRQNWGIRVKVHPQGTLGQGWLVVITMQSGSEVSRQIQNWEELQELSAGFRVPENAVVFGGQAFRQLQDNA